VAGESNTCCPQCGTLLIRRSGYTILATHLQGDQCPTCGKSTPGVWEAP